MRWTYEITTAARPKVLMRLVQVFDQQLLTIDCLHLRTFEDHVTISLTVDVETELAYRIRAKLYNLTDIRNVDLQA